MKKNIILYCLLLFVAVSSQAQVALQTQAAITNYEAISQEQVYVHANTTLLFTGEYLYYKVYVIDKNNTPSKVSTVAYVSLVGTDNKKVFTHKIALENGKGQGDYFMSPNVYSGNYKLVAYTQWMLNTNKPYFSQDVSVINPYQDNQKAITEVPDGEATPSPNNNTGSSTLINVVLDKRNYTTRDLVKLSFNATNNDVERGNYSVSVRRKDAAFNVAPAVTANEYANQFSAINNTAPISNVLIPELRGELLSGVVTANGNPVANKEVSIAISGENYILKMAKTNDKGQFFTSIGDGYEQDAAFVQVMDENPSQYQVTFNDPANVDVSGQDFFNFKISEAQENEILRRSINNQVESNYFVVKPDSVVGVPQITPFYGAPTVSFLLDDYTRFADLKETFVEVVDQASIISAGDGTQEFYVRPYEFSFQSGAKPLVLMDGIIIQNHNDLMGYNAKGIKRINILRDKYYLGDAFYQGIVDIQTIDGNYATQLGQDYIKKFELFKPQSIKNYYRQSYSETSKATYERVPDYRSQLLWKPSYTFEDSSNSTYFYTSDTPGTYVIHLEGFTKLGTPVSIKQEFTVVK